MRRVKNNIAEDLGIKDSLIHHTFEANKEMLKMYVEHLCSDSKKYVYGPISIDFCAFNPKSWIDEFGGYHNYVYMPNKDQHVPITHGCAYVFTPFEQGLPKLLLFF